MKQATIKQLVHTFSAIWNSSNDAHQEMLASEIDFLADFLEENEEGFDRIDFYNKLGIIPPEDAYENAIS